MNHMYIHGSSTDILKLETANGTLLAMPLNAISPLMYPEGFLNVVIPEHEDESGVTHGARAYRIVIQDIPLPF